MAEMCGCDYGCLVGSEPSNMRLEQTPERDDATALVQDRIP